MNQISPDKFAPSGRPYLGVDGVLRPIDLILTRRLEGMMRDLRTVRAQGKIPVHSMFEPYIEAELLIRNKMGIPSSWSYEAVVEMVKKGELHLGDSAGTPGPDYTVI